MKLMEERIKAKKLEEEKKKEQTEKEGTVTKSIDLNWLTIKRL